MTHSSSPDPSPTSLVDGDEEPLLVVTGATAVGKTALSLALAQRALERSDGEVGLEIITMDSMQVYRGMDIGTAKPTGEELGSVPHHGLDLVSPAESFDVSRWLAAAELAMAKVRSAGGRALFVGGTGFYLQALVRGLFSGPAGDPVIRRALETRADEEGSAALHVELARHDPPAAERIHPNDKKRVVRALEVYFSTGRTLSAWQSEWGWHGRTRPERRHRILGLALPKSELDVRIDERTGAMLAAGWPQEVRSILDLTGFGPSAIQALGYRDVIALVEGRQSRAETQARIALATRQFARRQKTWFQRFPDALWLDPQDPDLIERAWGHLFG